MNIFQKIKRKLLHISTAEYRDVTSQLCPACNHFAVVWYANYKKLFCEHCFTWFTQEEYKRKMESKL